MVQTVDDVREFWESSPLFAGDSAFPVGSREFFEEHRSVCIQDCLAGTIDFRIFPKEPNRDKVLDLGCGPGFWVVELSRVGVGRITAADLTETALTLTRARAESYGIEVETRRENAECLSFDDCAFSHVNCQGVIHHTPDTQACVREIARVLRPRGTASISVYHRNIFLRSWPVLRFVGKVLSRFGGGLRGRGRERIFETASANDIVRFYDGAENPVGKAYSKREFVAMLAPYFEVEALFLHFFPARALPFSIPGWLHRFLDRKTGFMLYANVRKRELPDRPVEMMDHSHTSFTTPI